MNISITKKKKSSIIHYSKNTTINTNNHEEYITANCYSPHDGDKRFGSKRCHCNISAPTTDNRYGGR